MRTTTVDTYCTITGDVCLHGTVSVAISGLSLTNANVHTLQLCEIGRDTELAAASSVAVAGGNATASLTLESAALISALGARKEINGQLYLWDATAVIPAWNGQIKVRWAPAPTGYVATTPGATAITAAAAAALITAHETDDPAHAADVISVAATPTNYTAAAARVEDHMAGIDTKLGTVAALSDTAPVALGAAAAGNGTTASRHNHVHPTQGLVTNPHLSYIDITEIAAPTDPAADRLRLYVEDVKGFSFFSFRDSTGMVRKLARDAVYVAKNTTVDSIAIGKVVYASGSSGNVPTIALARANAIATMPDIGVTVEAIAAGAFGRVMHVGLLENVNTNAFTEGDVLYVSADTAGELVSTPPTYPNIRQEVGTVLVKSIGAGSIQVIVKSMIYEPYIDHTGLLNRNAASAHTPTAVGSVAYRALAALPTGGGIVAGEHILLTAQDATAKAGPGEYMSPDGTNWVCIECHTAYAWGNLGATPTLALIAGCKYLFTQDQLISACAVTMAFDGSCDFVKTGAFTFATPTMADHTVLQRTASGWTDAGAAVVEGCFNHIGTRLAISAVALV